MYIDFGILKNVLSHSSMWLTAYVGVVILNTTHEHDMDMT